MSTPISGRVGEGAQSEPVNLDEFEAIAREKLPHASYEYFAGGAGDEEIAPLGDPIAGTEFEE